MDDIIAVRRCGLLHNAVEYRLVCDFHEPDMDVVKMVMETEDGQSSEFPITSSYEWQISSWCPVTWTIHEREPLKHLTCYLEDAEGHRSAPYTLTVTLLPD